jgi:hypothetical protein
MFDSPNSMRYCSVNGIDIFTESVNDSAQWCCVKEGHLKQKDFTLEYSLYYSISISYISLE